MNHKTCLKCGKAKSAFHFGRSESHCLICQRRENQRARYRAKPDEHRKASKAYHAKVRQTDPERLKAYHSEYYANNKSQWIKYAANRDPEKLRRAGQLYRDNNREKVREGVRAWFRRHPHASAIAASKYRIRLVQSEDTLTRDQVEETLEFFDHRCGYCLVDLRALPKWQRTLDHILPLVRGGSNTQENIIPCCKACNSRKKDRHIALMARYIDRAPFLSLAFRCSIRVESERASPNRRS